MYKRGEKRKEWLEVDMEVEEAEVVRKSTRVERSPKEGENGAWMEMVKEMRKGFKDIMDEIREMREEREDMKKCLVMMKEGWDKEREVLVKRVLDLERRLEKCEYKEKR